MTPPTPSLAWMVDALCSQVGHEPFFPEKSDHASARKARAICAACPVQAECLAYATPRADLWGIWGGTTERERMAMRGEKLRAEKGRTKKAECKNGHPRTPENVRKDYDCRQCNLDRQARYRARRRESAA